MSHIVAPTTLRPPPCTRARESCKIESCRTPSAGVTRSVEDEPADRRVTVIVILTRLIERPLADAERLRALDQRGHLHRGEFRFQVALRLVRENGGDEHGGKGEAPQRHGSRAISRHAAGETWPRLARVFFQVQGTTLLSDARFRPKPGGCALG